MGVVPLGGLAPKTRFEPEPRGVKSSPPLSEAARAAIAAYPGSQVQRIPRGVSGLPDPSQPPDGAAQAKRARRSRHGGGSKYGSAHDSAIRRMAIHGMTALDIAQALNKPALLVVTRAKLIGVTIQTALAQQQE